MITPPTVDGILGFFADLEDNFADPDFEFAVDAANNGDVEMLERMRAAGFRIDRATLYACVTQGTPETAAWAVKNIPSAWLRLFERAADPLDRLSYQYNRLITFLEKNWSGEDDAKAIVTCVIQHGRTFEPFELLDEKRTFWQHHALVKELIKAEAAIWPPALAWFQKRCYVPRAEVAA